MQGVHAMCNTTIQSWMQWVHVEVKDFEATVQSWLVCVDSDQGAWEVKDAAIRLVEWKIKDYMLMADEEDWTYTATNITYETFVEMAKIIDISRIFVDEFQGTQEVIAAKALLSEHLQKMHKLSSYRDENPEDDKFIESECYDDEYDEDEYEDEDEDEEEEGEEDEYEDEDDYYFNEEGDLR